MVLSIVIFTLGALLIWKITYELMLKADLKEKKKKLEIIKEMGYDVNEINESYPKKERIKDKKAIDDFLKEE